MLILGLPYSQGGVDKDIMLDSGPFVALAFAGLFAISSFDGRVLFSP